MKMPHVIMLVTNDVTTDARVRKSALAIAAAGARVTVVATTTAEDRSDSMLGPVRITRVPVEFVLRDHVRRRSAHRRRRGLPGLRPLSSAEEQVLRHEAAARARDRDPATRTELREGVSRDLVRARRLLGRVGTQAGRTLWGGLDRARSQLAVGARWRRVLPEVNDYEMAFGPVVDALEPDVIHAHDVQTLPIAARAVARASASGRRVPWIYDAHEWVSGLSQYAGRPRRTVAAWADLEREFIGRADRVVTVTAELAAALQARYGLARRPSVVMNIPSQGPLVQADPARAIRAAAGVPEGVPLLVYSGGVTEARGVHTAVGALTHLPEAHLAVVAVPNTRTAAVQRLLDDARLRGVADRVHAIEPVPPDSVVGFLRGADVGLIPLLHYGSHEFALANKLFEYLHAGMPMVVSDCRAQAAFVTQRGLGLVHRADDAADLAHRVGEVLAQPDVWREALVREAANPDFTWEAQAAALVGVYEELASLAQAAARLPLSATEPIEEPFERDRTGATRLGIGPTNSAGQGWAWSQAIRRRWPSIETEVVSLINGKYDYPTDIAVDRRTFRYDPAWGMATREHARETWSHALIEAGRPLFGSLVNQDANADIRSLQQAGVAVGLVFHGSEVRSPRLHAATHPFSPFAHPQDPMTERLQAVVDRNLALVEAFDGPVFVSTPDQLDYVRDAVWLPVCIDLDAWQPEPRTRSVPLVVHAPSNPALKGTERIERAIAPLIESGRIEYTRVSGMQPDQAAAVIREADVVIDQVLLGLYGVLACEALASGAVVLGHVGDRLRSRVPAAVPITEVTPVTLATELEGVLDRLDELREGAAERRGFVKRFHSGCYSAGVLSHFLGRENEHAHDEPEAQ